MALAQGRDWALWLEEFRALRLFVQRPRERPGVGDRRARRAHVIDYWLRDGLVERRGPPAARPARGLGERIADHRRAMAKLHGDRRAIAAPGAIGALEFTLAMRGAGSVRELYEPTRPGGLPWTDASAASAVREICATLRRIVSDVGWAARERRAQRAALRRPPRADRRDRDRAAPGSAWRREDVLRALGQEAHCAAARTT